MTDELLAYSVAKMKEYGIVDSGDAATLGIGAMTDARMKSFFDKMVRAGVVKPSLDLRQGLHAAVREQEGRARPAAEELTSADRNDPQRRPRSVRRLRGVGKTFANGVVALDGFDFALRAGRVRVAARAVRLRQVDGAAHHRRAERADERHGRMAALWTGGKRARDSASCSRSRR